MNFMILRTNTEEKRDYKKKVRRVSRALKKWGSASMALPSVAPQAKNKWILPRFVSTPSGLTFDFKKLKQDVKTISQQRFFDICVILINTKEKGRIIRCLLDTGCSKSNVLKKFTDKKQRLKLCNKDTSGYTVY